MQFNRSSIASFFLVTLFVPLLAGCSSEPPPPPTQSPARIYIEATDSERSLLNSASTESNNTWIAFSDSINPGFLSVDYDSQAASEARAAANTLVRRAESLRNKLRPLAPPANCQTWHTLLEEYADGAAAAATAKQAYISDMTDRQLQLNRRANSVNTTNAQVNQLIGPLNTATPLCR